MTRERIRFAQNDLARLSYAVAENDDAPTAVLLHGTLADRASLGAIRDALGADWTVILPDARGHGGSSALTGRTLTVADLANDVYAILDEEGETAPVALVGAGQGAVTALELARRRPDRVSAVVAIEPDSFAIPIDADDDAAREAIKAARATDLEAADLAYKGLADKALDAYFDRRRGPDWVTHLARPRLAAVRRSVQALPASINALDRWIILPEDFATMSTPVLVVTGVHSPVAERAIGSWIAGQIPGADHHVLADSSAAEPITSAAGLPGVVRSFLDAHREP